MTMEKYGVSKEQQLKELRDEYHRMKEDESQLIKTGSQPSAKQVTQIELIKMKIDELEKSE